MAKLTLPAGEYVIIDPVYVAKDYNRLIDDTNCFATVGFSGNGGVYTDGDTELAYAVFGTKHGDGRYEDQEGFTYPVDAGVIGCLPIAITDAAKMARQFPKDGQTAGRLATFDQEFTVSGIDGVIQFGHIVIDTDPDIEQEDEDYENIYSDVE